MPICWLIPGAQVDSARGLHSGVKHFTWEHMLLALNAWKLAIPRTWPHTEQSWPSPSATSVPLSSYDKCQGTVNGSCQGAGEAGQGGQGTGPAPGSQKGGAGAHGADQVDGQVTAAVVGQGEPRLSMLQPGDVSGFTQARSHRLAHLQPLANVSE